MTIEYNEEINDHLKFLVKEVTQAYCNSCAIVIETTELTEGGECPICCNDDLMSYHDRLGQSYELEEFFGLILELGKVKFLSYLEVEDRLYVEFVEDLYSPMTQIAHASVPTVRALKIAAPIDYRIGFNDFIDQITEEGGGEYVIHDDKFYKKLDILNLSVEELKNEKR